MTKQDKGYMWASYLVLSLWYMGAAANQYFKERKETGEQTDKLVSILFPELTNDDKGII